MDIDVSEVDYIPFRNAVANLGTLSSDVAAEMAALAGDVTLLIDAEGVVRDMAFGDAKLGSLQLGDWLNRPWVDSVALDSRPKIEQMLSPGGTARKLRWRQVNHLHGDDNLPIRYVTLGTGHAGWYLAIGRDLRATAALQKRLLQAQQSMERDYVRLRQSESRYRLLFDESSEAILIVDTPTRRVTEANPAAIALLGGGEPGLIGRSVSTLFHTDDRDRVISMLGSVAAAEQNSPVELRLATGNCETRASASLFIQGRSSYFLVRLVPTDARVTSEVSPDQRLVNVLERIPDAFVLTDQALTIITGNAAFLELTQFARKEQIGGVPLGQFIGRPGIDLNLLVAQLLEHGSVTNFSTIARDRFDRQDDVELAAVAFDNGGVSCFGFTIRSVSRLREQRPAANAVTRSVEQLTELVGRVSLKEIVRESSDLIERLCIEAALSFTSDNRASAAEILGLSRQSLYSKLHRYGLGNVGNDDE